MGEDEARGFRNSSSCRIENKLKPIKLTARKIGTERERERVAVVELAMNERGGDGLSTGMVKGVADSTKVMI